MSQFTFLNKYNRHILKKTGDFLLFLTYFDSYANPINGANLTVSGCFGASRSSVTNTSGYFNFGITPTVIGGPYALQYSVSSSLGNYSVSLNSLTVTAPVVVPVDKILQGVTIAGQTGTMPNMAAANPNGAGVGRSQAKEYWTGGGPTVFLKPQKGYYDGNNSWSFYNEPNLVPSNIKNGVYVLGVTGTYSGMVPIHGSREWITPGTYYWTVPDGVNSLVALIQAAGGGAGGGRVSGVTMSAGGGGGGGYSVVDINVTPGDILTIVVGAGGLGGTRGGYYDYDQGVWVSGTAGNDGGNSSVGNYSSTGGKGGQPGGSSPDGGLGGTGNSYGRHGTPGIRGRIESPVEALGGYGGMNNYGNGGMGVVGDGNNGSNGRVVVFW